jgi:hypothetical protein
MSGFQPLTKEESLRATTTPDSGLQARAIAGTEKSKDPFTEGQKRDAGFAVRMERALREIDELEDSGFDPVNFKDSVLVEYAPFIPDLAENFLKSPQYQLYQRAMNDFTTAQLRKETGAVINESEVVFINRSYVPQPGDDPATIAAKREARQLALAAMVGNAGKAYDKTKKEVDARLDDASTDPDEALAILRQRAKNDPELAERMRQRGLMP